MKVEITERGWPGHYILADRCRFRRNTLIAAGQIYIVVSTVGNLHCQDGPIEEIGCQRYYETMAFHACYDGIYWDVNVQKQISLKSPWQIKELTKDVDQQANDMHETAVREIVSRLRKGARL